MGRLREEIIGFAGPMYSRKTLFLLDHVNGMEAVGRTVLVFKPSNDTRFGLHEIQSRNGGSHSAIPIPINRPGEIFRYLKLSPTPIDLAAIDEIQFFSPRITETILTLAENGIKVVFTGLNRNYRGQTFLTMEKVMPLATGLQLTQARCMYTENGNPRMCGEEAQMTQRLYKGEPDSFNSPTVIIDTAVADYTYQARCPDHWAVNNMPPRRKIYG